MTVGLPTTKHITTETGHPASHMLQKQNISYSVHFCKLHDMTLLIILQMVETRAHTRSQTQGGPHYTTPFQSAELQHQPTRNNRSSQCQDQPDSENPHQDEPTQDTPPHEDEDESQDSDLDVIPIPVIKRRIKTPPPVDKGPATFKFYDKTKKPSQHVCPFSAEGRENRCTTHAKPSARRDRIHHHLLDIKLLGGDAHHPITDPLWQQWIVEYYIMKRPTKLPPAVKQKRASEQNKVGYAKRVKRVEELGAEMKRKLENGEITDDAYDKFLTGAPRADFRRRREISKRVEKRLEVLKRSPAENADAIAQLEEVGQQLQNTKDHRVRIQKQLIGVTKGMIGFWEGSDSESKLLHEDQAFRRTLSMARGWDTWPTEPSIQNYYTIAAFLLPFDYVPAPWMTETMRLAKANVRWYETSEKRRMEFSNLDISVQDTKKQELLGLVQTFNSCCDLVAEDYEHETETSRNNVPRQSWIDKHHDMWQVARENARNLTAATYHGKSPLEVMTVVDMVAQCWGAHNDAIRAEEEAASRADTLLL